MSYPEQLQYFNPETGESMTIRAIRSEIRMVEALGYRPLTVPDERSADDAMGRSAASSRTQPTETP